MSGIIHHPSSIISRERGVALLVVLFVIMAITIISLGFVSRCDTELACGRNMLLRTQMDQLADSGLEHARGLILQPQDVSSEYWTGAAGQQLIADSPDFYTVNVTRDESNPNERCDYSITCEAYELKNGEKVGSSRLSAQLRLDPCIALWTDVDTLFRRTHVLHGDFYCARTVLNLGDIRGDVFSKTLMGTGTVTGQRKAAEDLLPLLDWPPVTSEYVNPVYGSYPVLPGTLAETTYQPARIWRCAGDLILGNNVTIQGMLLVDGSLAVRGSTNLLTAAKNLPALYVSGDLIVEEVDNLKIEGLAVVEGSTRISAGASNIRILGGLFVKGGIAETAADSAGGNSDFIVCDAPTWRPNNGGKYLGALEFDGVNDYLRTPDNASLQLTGDYTISLWINPAVSQKASAAILAKTDAAGSANHWALQFDAAMELRVWHPTDSWPTGITMADLGAGNRWYHVAVVRQGNTMSSYLDGSLRKQGNWNTGPGIGSGHLNIAADRTAAPEYLYTGLIDDIRIYSQAVTVPLSDGLPGLIGHWKLDESGSDVIIVAEPARSAVVALVPNSFGQLEEVHWSQAAGAFYRSIHRD